jgi:hypothetical protein
MGATTSRKAGAAVSATTTIDFGDLQRRLTDAERKVLTKYRGIILDGTIKSRWIGWDYADRPEDAPRNVSLKAWKARIETTEGKAVLIIVNEALDWRKKQRTYAAYVHRAGDSTTEVDHIAADLQANTIPLMVADLTAAVAAEMTAPKRIRKLRARGGGTTVRRELGG